MSYQDPNNPNQFNPNPYNPNPFQSPQQFSGYQPQPFYGQDPYKKVQGPAIALLIFGIVGLVLVLLAAIVQIVLLGAVAVADQNPLEQGDGAKFIMEMARSWFTIISGFISSIVIILGSLKMKKLESMGLARTAAILAMIPCISPCCPIGLPIGIWALNVLDRPEVKASFR